MKLYDFTGLINKYSVSFDVVSETEGAYDGGIYIPGKTVTEAFTGAIVPIAERKIYQSGGAYTTQDKQLYTHKRIPDALLKGKVRYKDCDYSIEEGIDHSDFCGAFVYTLKRANVNDKQQKNS